MKLTNLFLLAFAVLTLSQCAPPVDLTLVPEDDGIIRFQEMAAPEKGGASAGQLSILAWIQNKKSTPILLTKAEIITGGKTYDWEPGLNDSNKNPNPIPANGVSFWSNGRGYNEIGKVIILSEPFPTTVTLSLYFEGYSEPFSITRPLAAYDGASMQFMARAEHLDVNEYWSGWSRHGSGGSQVFGLDLGVEAWDGSGWTSRYPDTDGSENEHYRCYGKPIYAMADGTVLNSKNDHDENPNPPEKIEYQNVSGNFFEIQHGDIRMKYSHFQKGSLNPDLLEDGATVSKGDFLGLTGNSGNSTSPHLHIHALKVGSLSRNYRPINFVDAEAVGKSVMTEPSITNKWEDLNNRTISTDKVLIRPCQGLNWSEYTRFGLPASFFQAEFDKMAKAGYYLAWISGYENNNQLFFNAVFKPNNGTAWIAKYGLTANEYQEEFDQRTEEGYRLTHVDSYISNGQVKYACVFRKISGLSYRAYHGLNAQTHQQLFEEYADERYVPTHISVVDQNGQLFFTAIYEEKDVNGYVHLPDLTAAQYQERFDALKRDGLSPVYIDAYSRGENNRFSVIWYRQTPFNELNAVHGNTSQEFQQAFDTNLGNSFSTRCIVGYPGRQGTLYAGLWTKQ